MHKRMSRGFAEECSYLEPVSDCSIRIKKGFVPNMNVSETAAGSPKARLIACLKNFFVLMCVG